MTLLISRSLRGDQGPSAARGARLRSVALPIGKPHFTKTARPCERCGRDDVIVRLILRHSKTLSLRHVPNGPLTDLLLFMTGTSVVIVGTFVRADCLCHANRAEALLHEAI
jgi:hypothetical protein